jgi:hypothetical protein
MGAHPVVAAVHVADLCWATELLTLRPCHFRYVFALVRHGASGRYGSGCITGRTDGMGIVARAGSHVSAAETGVSPGLVRCVVANSDVVDCRVHFVEPVRRRAGCTWAAGLIDCRVPGNGCCRAVARRQHPIQSLREASNSLNRWAPNAARSF